MLRYKIDRVWFSCLVQHLARKWSGSILTTPELARGTASENSREDSKNASVDARATVHTFGMSHQ